MKERIRCLRAIAVGFGLAVGGLLPGGCEAPHPGSAIEHIPQITGLYEKATSPPRAHRFRRPLRDERERALRLLSEQCDRVVAEVRSEGISAEALTGLTPRQQDMRRAKVEALAKALTELGAGADKGDEQAMRSAHAAALSVYARIED